uniref:Phorbol-ester/DAG-type domain-containing protein n=1 Tax=Panagrolaimus sp. ES5 TaxID=591445 RepID=A0AC34G295_9BILA
MKNLREEMDSLKGTNNVLQERLTETEGSNDFASKYYTEEINKIKAQKAELRCDLIRMRREHDKCLQNEKENDDVSKEFHEKEVSEFKKKIAELETKLNETKRVAAENESSEKGQIEQLTADLKKANSAVALNQEALQTLDKQAEELVKRVQLENASKKAAKKKVAELESEVKEFKRQMENKKMMEDELANLKVENDKLLDKITYLENEIRETHTDHREELAKLAQQVTKARAMPISDNRQSEELLKKIAHLEATIRQNENVARSLQRQIDQSKNEVISAEKALSDMREKQCTIVNENTDLRRALQEALIKLQAFKANEDKLKEADTENKAEIDRLEGEISNLQDEIAELRDALNQKEENIAYLQSIQQPRKLEKLKITNSQSTLVTGADDEMEVEQLVATRDALARQVNERTQMLQKKKEEIVPLLKASSVCSESSVDINHPNMSANSSRSRIGTMRHDIPHRWSKAFVTVFTPKCEMCYDGVPRFTYAHRCKSCHLVVHSHCKSSVLNTCGLPAACANFYHENHSVTNDRMSGWVKILQAEETVHKKWLNAFAIFEGNSLSFYESDLSFNNAEGPFFTIDLSQQRWKIFNQTGNIRGIDTGNAESLIEIKLKSESLFMLTSTPAAKRNWIRALQNATNRRILDRNASNVRVMSMSTVIGIGKPLLKFQCTEIYHDWLLIGTPQGLFATTFSNPRMPFQLAGFSNVFQ